MTTPDIAPDANAPRVTRPEAERIGPIRGGSTTASPAADPSAPASMPMAAVSPAPVHDPATLAVNNAVAGSVKTAYDVLAETVEQGRKAAEQFRVGAYNVRDVPDDVRHLAGNLIGLARQLSAATFDICEALLRQTGAAGAAPTPGSTYVPPFPHMPPMTGADRQPDYSNAPPAAAKAQMMRLAVRFAGTDRAIARTPELLRPSAPTAPSDIRCAPLAAQSPDIAALTDVTFAADLAGGGLIATITVPQGQPAGVYSGVVSYSTPPMPLGLLVVELQG